MIGDPSHSSLPVESEDQGFIAGLTEEIWEECLPLKRFCGTIGVSEEIHPGTW